MSYRFAVITEREIAIRPADDRRRPRGVERRSPHRRCRTSPSATIELLRAEESPDRLMLLAESGGQVVGSGVADRSHITGGYVAPRVLPEHRRHGVGSALLRVLLDHLIDRGFGSVGAHVEDDAAARLRDPSRLPARSTGRSSRCARSTPDEPRRAAVRGRRVLDRRRSDPNCSSARSRSPSRATRTWSSRPARRSSRSTSGCARRRPSPAGRSWRSSTGSSSGMPACWPGPTTPTRAENGLTVVDRRWRGRGLATALKQRQLAWAAANGIREIVTWTQEGNEAMQRRQRQRSATRPRSVSRTMRRDLP